MHKSARLTHLKGNFMSNNTTADVTGIFSLDTNRLVGLAAKGSPDVTYLAGQDTPTSGIPLTVTLTSDGGIEYSAGADRLLLAPGRHPTPKWDAARAKAKAGRGNAKLLFIGDSTMMGAWAGGTAFDGNAARCWARKLAAQLGYSTASFYGDQGVSIGLVGGIKDSTYKLYDPRVTYDATWAIAVGYALGGYLWQSGGTSRGTLSFAPGVTFDHIDIFYTTSYAGAYGSFTVDIGGGGLATVNTGTNTLGVGKATVTCASGVNTVNITKSTDGFVQIRGVSCYRNNADVQCIVAGWSTMTALRYLSGGTGTETPQGPTADIPQIAPDMTGICLGINDSTGLVPVEDYRSAMQRIIDVTRVTGDVVLHVPNTINPAGNPIQDPYWQVVYDLAKANRLNVIDYRERMIDWATANALGLMIDGRHPLEAGYQLMAMQAYESGIYGR